MIVLRLVSDRSSGSFGTTDSHRIARIVPNRWSLSNPVNLLWVGGAWRRVTGLAAVMLGPWELAVVILNEPRSYVIRYRLDPTGEWAAV